MTVEDLLSFRRENGILGNVTIWKSGDENLNEYEKIAEFNPDFYKTLSREILDLKVENYDIDFDEGCSPEPSLAIFVNQENNTKKIQELFNR